jgi:cellulose biosynthesis protein BcsQ
MIKIALFNHKGGVGKTTLTVNIANAFAEAGHKVLLVDADPQCNLTSFYLKESDLEQLLGDSDGGDSPKTLWSGVKPVVEGRGGVVPIPNWTVPNRTIEILPGDVLLSEYEEVLPEAWTECFARRTRGYDITTALSQVVNEACQRLGTDICMYDVGPNVGALNRAVLLDCDYFITPVAADLFSLRALSTVGRSVAKWIKDWRTIRKLADPEDQARVFDGMPRYIGYITSAFKVSTGANAADPHAEWERKIAPRVRDRIVKDLQAVDAALVPDNGGNKIGGVKHYQSLAPAAQKEHVAIGQLRGFVNSGHYATVDAAGEQFAAIAREILNRTAVPATA